MQSTAPSVARRYLSVLTMVVALVAAGCGGGGGTNPPADTGGGGPDAAVDSGGEPDVGAVDTPGGVDTPADTGGPGPDAVTGEDVLGVDGGPETTTTCIEDQPCNDHDPCTQDDVCTAAGVCAGTAYSCDDGLECTTDMCDGAGGCTAELVVGACLIDDACHEQGAAQPGAPCNQCLPGTDPYAWSDAEGGRCEDGDQCTVGDRCADGVCEPGPGTLPCNDNDLCNGVESCDPAEGCVAGAALDCDDENACNGSETCDPLAGCQAGTPLQCGDANVCDGEESCDPATGCVEGAPLPCDDGDACNGVEGCDPLAGCTAGIAPQCDDGQTCNGVETCDAATGCVDAPDLDCDDQNDCTVDGCSEPAGCVYQDRNSGACADDNPCTAAGTCSAGECVGAEAVCPPGEFCAVGCEDTAQVWCLDTTAYPLDCADYGATCGVVDDAPACVCDETYEQRCEGANLIVCTDGVLGQVDCAAADAGCSVDLDGNAACRCDAATHEPTCTDQFTLAVCGEEGEVLVLACGELGGLCQENSGQPSRCVCGEEFAPSCADAATQVVCAGGAEGDLLLLDCAALGTTCAAAGAAEGCVCGAGRAPSCDGDLLVTCAAGGVAAVTDCALAGGTCGVGADGAATCLGPGCPNIPATNVCEGDVLHRCVDGFEETTDCATLGLTCAVDPATGANGCRAAGGECGAVTEAGECRGDLVLWCDGGVLQQFDCGHYGAACGEWVEQGFFWCECSGAAFEPGCYGAVGLATCGPEGWLEVADCGALGGTCGVGDLGQAACVGDGCGAETFLGRCDGESIVWCQDRLVLTQDCAATGELCGWNVESDFYACLAEAPDCSGLPAAGECTFNVLESCDADGHAVGVDCAATGRTCGFSAAAGANACLGCAGVPAEGVCDADVLYWCGDDLVQAFDCAAWGTTCGPDGAGGESCLCTPADYEATCVEDVLVSCHPYSVLQTTDCAALGATCTAGDGGALACVGGGCGGVTFEGECDGGVLSWCENQLVYTADCALYGYACGFEAEGGIFNCLPPQGDCAGETAAGRCDGDVLVWCDTTGGFAEPARRDCAALGQVCDETDDPGVFGCVAPTQCGDETFQGRCAGDVLIWCAEDAIHRVDCAVSGLRCDDGGALADCIDPVVGCGAVTVFGSCDGAVLSWCDGDVVRTVDCAAGDLVCGDDGVLGMNCIRPETAGACDPACPVGFLCVEGLCRANGSQPRDWTYLVYIAGDNNLSPAALGDIAELEQVGTSARVAVVALAEFSTPTGPPAELRGNTFRFAVPYAPAEGPNVAAIVPGNIGNQNMGDPATLAAFIRWGAETYPAKRYALVLWNHGAGWMGGFQDETAGDELSLREIRDGIGAAGFFLDLVDFDACLMGMYEITAELSDVAAYVAASEEVEPGCGNPYHEILGALAADPAMGGRALAIATVDEYIAWYGSDAVDPGCRLDVTKAALDLSRTAAFHERVSAFATALQAELRTKRATILDVIGASQAFHFPFYRDVVDLAQRVADSSLAQPTRAAAEALIPAVNGAGGIVIRNGVLEQTGFNDLSGANGLSIFAPDLVDAQTYPGLLASYVASLMWRQRQSAWSVFVERLLGTTGDDGVAVSGGVRLEWFANAEHTVPVDANLDLWLIEPDNALYGPLLGTVTPNGQFSPESNIQGTTQESYAWAESVQPGSYLFFVIFDSPGQRLAWPEVTIDLAGVAGYPVTLRRVDGNGQDLPMSLDTPLNSPLGRIFAGDLTPEEIEGMWLGRYSNVWMIPAVVIE